MTLTEADWAQARAAARGVAGRLPGELVRVDALAGRVLARDCEALIALPHDDTSAMDGWAVAGEGPWTVVGDVRAGLPWARMLVPGEAVRIATGGVIPTGTDAVIRWEVATLDGATLHGGVEPGRDIRRAGEECGAGDRIASAGIVVSPALAGLLAATGHDTVDVVRRPRASVLLLGDELQSSGIPTEGRVRDSLGPQLPGWLSRMGAEVAERQHVPDDLAALQGALEDVGGASDVVITTGSTAAGPRDHLHAAIESVGGVLVVDRVAVKPGHPMLLAVLDIGGRAIPLIGLPGNPHSAIVGLLTLGQPVIASLLGLREGTVLRVPTREELRSPAAHTRLIAGTLREGHFDMAPYQGSAMLRGLAQSTGFAVAPAGMTPAGALVEWLPLP